MGLRPTQMNLSEDTEPVAQVIVFFDLCLFGSASFSTLRLPRAGYTSTALSSMRVTSTASI